MLWVVEFGLRAQCESLISQYGQALSSLGQPAVLDRPELDVLRRLLMIVRAQNMKEALGMIFVTRTFCARMTIEVSDFIVCSTTGSAIRLATG